MVQEVYIIDNNTENLAEELKQKFNGEADDYNFKIIKTWDIDVALRNIPSLLIIDEDQIDVDSVEFCKKIRSNEDNCITPIIVVSSNREKDHVINVLSADVQYYIKKPIDPVCFFYTIRNVIQLLSKNRRISPLTGLPGNVQIQAEIKKRLLNNETFAILYFDLDNFKAYNDVYGFANGDEIIKFTARTISKHIHEIKDIDCFIGHVGGDDFVAIISPSDYDKICKDIIAEFDSEAVKFYNEEDAERGFVEVANRRGIIEQFPLTSISIAVLEVSPDTFKTPLEIGEIAGQIKHRAKTILGSTYVINRRRF